MTPEKNGSWLDRHRTATFRGGVALLVVANVNDLYTFATVTVPDIFRAATNITLPNFDPLFGPTRLIASVIGLVLIFAVFRAGHSQVREPATGAHLTVKGKYREQGVGDSDSAPPPTVTAEKGSVPPPSKIDDDTEKRPATAETDRTRETEGNPDNGAVTTTGDRAAAPKLANVPAGPIRDGFVKELEAEWQALSRRGGAVGVDIWKLPTAANAVLERQWRVQVKGWEERVARFEQKWGTNATFSSEVDAVAPRLRASELAQVPPPAWRGDLLARLRAGGLWLARHHAENWE
jgi:hypothetical protein